jgi:hypothetical protein
MTDQQQQYPHIDDSLLQPVEASREEFDGLLEELRTEVSLADAEAALVDSARHNEADVVRAILTVYPHAIHSALDAHRNSPLHMAAANGHVVRLVAGILLFYQQSAAMSCLRPLPLLCA